MTEAINTPHDADVIPFKGRRRKPAVARDGATFGPIKLADMLIPRLQGRYRYCADLGWLAWTGAKWETGSGAEDLVLQEVVATVKAYAHRIIEDKGLSREATSELSHFSAGSCQTHAMKIARGAVGIRTRLDVLDAQPALDQPYRLHCANGVTIELHRNGSKAFRPTTPEDLNTKVACVYDPNARASQTGTAFAKYQPDHEVRRYMLQMWAKGLSGQGSSTFTAHVGGNKKDRDDQPRGGNGKSTMMTAVAWVAGEYAATLPVEVILKTRAGANNREVYRSELAELRGARIVNTAEPPAMAKLATNLVNDLTGGSDITARRMRQDSMKFTPRILLSMAANHRPAWDEDGGMERRYVEIEWRYEIPTEEMRESFMDELRVETSGMLNAILDHWQGDVQIEPPAVVVAMTEAGKNAASPIYQFTREALTSTPGETVSGALMYDVYCEWARQSNERPVSSTKFGIEMGRLGVARQKSRSANLYLDLAIEEEYRPRAGF